MPTAIASAQRCCFAPKLMRDAAGRQRFRMSVSVAMPVPQQLRHRAVTYRPLSKAELAQSRVIVGAPAERPVILAIALLDGKIVDAGDAQAHQTMLVEFPVLVAVAAEPMTAVVMPLIGEAHGDTIVTEGPDLLDQAVIELAVPFARQERLDGLAALQEFRAVAPAAVGRIGKRDAAGSRVFQASSAMRAFCAAVSAVKGGNGGRLMVSP